MNFPRLVFTSPGPETCNGGTYGYKRVEDEGAFTAAIEAGFFASVPEALAGETVIEPEPEPEPEANVTLEGSKFRGL